MANEKRIGALWLSKSANPKAPFAKGEIEVDGKDRWSGIDWVALAKELGAINA